MRIGSLFSGAGGLDMAVEQVFGGEVIWHSELDKAASKVLAYRFPCAPNLGDITKVDWKTVEPVDVLCGGFPCQDVSAAGKRAGIKDGTRSGLWAIFAEAIEQLRPPIVVIENVRGLLSAAAHRDGEKDEQPTDLESAASVVGNGAGRPVLRAAGAVLGDLADLGYDAQWTTLAAADVGAPHRRERVFIVASDTGYGDDSERARQAGRKAGERQAVGSFAGRDSDRSAADTSGAAVRFDTRGASGAQTRTQSGDRFGDHRGERSDVALLPTPSACNPNDGEGTETWLARREAVKARVKNGNGMGMPLSIAVQLLPTPTTSDSRGAACGGAHDENVRVPRLAAAVEVDLPAELAARTTPLLPTPTTQDASNTAGPSQFNRNTLPLNTEVTLLSTPQSRDYKGRPADGFNNANLCRDIALLCTPAASDGAGGKTSRSGGRIDEPLLGGQAREMATAWGKYEPAIRRWEALTRPAPAPTEPNKNGNPRLAAAFSEWLMGWPAGWVTDPDIGISRNDQFRIVGNGVCPQQAAAALRFLLAVTA